MKKFFPIFSIILGLYWVICGFNYGVWVNRGPGGGLFPIIAGAMAIIFSLLVLAATKKDKSYAVFSWKAFLPVGALVILLLCSYMVGLIISIAIYVFLWLKFMEKYKTTKSLVIGICCAAVIYVVFVAWLSVPLPTGLLGIL